MRIWRPTIALPGCSMAQAMTGPPASHKAAPAAAISITRQPATHARIFSHRMGIQPPFLCRQAPPLLQAAPSSIQSTAAQLRQFRSAGTREWASGEPLLQEAA
jgi:hypothetical protein